MQKYPRDVPPRYELRQGKFGPYFYDYELRYDMPLNEVLNTLNRYALRKAQLTWYVAAYGEPQPVTQIDEDAVNARLNVIADAADEAISRWLLK